MMVEIYVKLIRLGMRTIEEVPESIRAKVEAVLAET